MSRYNKLSRYMTKVTRANDGGMTVTYHSTPIVHVDPEGVITLNSGGWRSVTTKRKMNQAANEFGLAYSVYQRKGEWFVDHGHGEIPFVDGMVLDWRKERGVPATGSNL